MGVGEGGGGGMASNYCGVVLCYITPPTPLQLGLWSLCNEGGGGTSLCERGSLFSPGGGGGGGGGAPLLQGVGASSSLLTLENSVAV